MFGCNGMIRLKDLSNRKANGKEQAENLSAPDDQGRPLNSCESRHGSIGMRVERPSAASTSTIC